MNIQALGSVEVLHRNAFNAGPRVTRIDYLRVDGNVVAVDFWVNPNGALVRVDAPRALRPGETLPAAR